MQDWKHKDSWKKHGEHFMVEVTRHSEVMPEGYAWDSDGPHRWCVYAYIYPNHWHFAAFDGSEKIWQEAAVRLPFHRGPSFCRKHMNAEGEVTSYQVGADYNHLYDDRFTSYATPQEAAEVFLDAQELFDVLASIQN